MTRAFPGDRSPMGLARVKICGITMLGEGRIATAAGADAIGCLVGLSHPSPDEISPEAAARIFEQLPPFVSRVLVTHRTTHAEVVELVRSSGASVVQLHGAYPSIALPDLRRDLPSVALVKAIHVVTDASIDEALEAALTADAILLDSRTADRIGGTGQVHDWTISARIVERSSKPVILAGGLTPENVAEAVLRVRPYAVDVNSGVRGPDGLKSAERIADFVDAARGQGIR